MGKKKLYEMKGLSRIDQTVKTEHKKGKGTKSTHGWYCRVYTNRKEYRKFFADSKHGGKEKAKKEAVKWLKQMHKKYGIKEGSAAGPRVNLMPPQHNSSGWPGVHRCHTVTRDRFPDTYWAATWTEHLSNGKIQPKDKAFRFREYKSSKSRIHRTEIEAKRLAILWRAKMVKKFLKPGLPFKKSKIAWIPGQSIEELDLDQSGVFNAAPPEYEIKNREPFEKRIHALKKPLGDIAYLYQWDEIDYQFGRGIISPTHRCFWLSDGCRIDVLITGMGKAAIKQWMQPDPYYTANAQRK